MAPVVGVIKAAGAWLTTTFGATAAGAIMNIGGSVLLSVAAQALMGKPKQGDMMRELTMPTSLPPYRYVYGKCWAPGSPAPVRVKDDIIYACYILNSRPSEGPFTLYLDKRRVEYTGDPYDFSGGGATGTNGKFGPGSGGPHLWYWISRGDRSAPPQMFLDEAPELYRATDGWQGLTVLWVKFRAGSSDDMNERWPSSPPEVMVDGYWSRVWDPRDPAQSPTDASTWQWSANQALCTLDALRTNPLRPYGDAHLWTETFAWAAQVADERVEVKAGGTIPRYEVNGVLVWSEGSEIEDQVIPLANAGAAEFTRVGGRLGLVPGIYRAPVMTLSNVLDDAPLQFRRYRPSTELVTAVSATYVSPDRAYEDATTPVYRIANAQIEDGGVVKLGQYDLRFVTDHRQGQRVAKIMGLKTRMQKSVTGVFPPEAFNLVGGSVVTLDLPAPYTGRNGTYVVEEANPGADVLGLDGVALRCALTLREYRPVIYAWNPATDEQDVAVEDFEAEISGCALLAPSPASAMPPRHLCRAIPASCASGLSSPRRCPRRSLDTSGSIASATTRLAARFWSGGRGSRAAPSTPMCWTMVVMFSDIWSRSWQGRITAFVFAR
ncbi:phage tail protein [Paracoccus sp. DMF-8]|uniref:phage tail protein n=1 Tax=Paracoccus sp. DMF-8 TaxID=3019445 RepID=UPI0023E85855|nr:phage tail protein [Paracoccus sp. DMF-8]MDF3606345.1 phage tail protein [Paracoccus sp. DMF-8]